jgi:hypothetical protein
MCIITYYSLYYIYYSISWYIYYYYYYLSYYIYYSIFWKASALAYFHFMLSTLFSALVYLFTLQSHFILTLWFFFSHPQSGLATSAAATTSTTSGTFLFLISIFCSVSFLYWIFFLKKSVFLYWLFPRKSQYKKLF